jgi:hypothetical protein
MNAAAVSCYRQDEMATAYSTLIDAFRQLRANCDDCSENHSIGNDGNFPAFSGVYCIEPTRVDLSSLIYNGAFLITDEIPCKSRSVAAILLFNVALVQHQQGMKHGESSYMERALKFYEMSVRLLDNFAESRTLTVLLAALYNNMKNIHESFFQSSLARQVTKELSELLHWMHLHSSVSEEELAFFEASLFLSALTSMSAAPAA